MIIRRDKYLDQLIRKKGNGRVKIVTGIRRSGKTFLLFKLFKRHLLTDGVMPENIIEIAFDDIRYKELRNAEACYQYVVNAIDPNNPNTHYILLDEVQLMDDFADALNGFLHLDRVDVFVTGSNSRFLSTDIVTEFRGRGDEVRMYPLSFAEFSQCFEGDKDEAWKQYYSFGGLPYLLHLHDDEEKIRYLQSLFQEVYLRDIVERNRVRHRYELEQLIDMLASSVGSLTNPRKLANSFRSLQKSTLSESTIRDYLRHLENAFLIAEAKRFNVKGKAYISTPSKYYFEDIGLRNAKLNFRQQDEGHIMENIIFNELRHRGYAVDVGVVDINEPTEHGTYQKKRVEIDFVANKGSQRYYIQSAFQMRSRQKENQELRPFLHVQDSFKKIVIVYDDIKAKRDENGIVTIGIKEFLGDEDSLGF